MRLVFGAGPEWLFAVRSGPTGRKVLHGPWSTHLFYKSFSSMSEIREFSDSQATWKRLTERVDGQSWPAASLYVVATPIGTLGDLRLRAWQALARCAGIGREPCRERGCQYVWIPLFAGSLKKKKRKKKK